jgi:hypothetical protein
MDSIGLIFNKDGSTSYHKEKATPSFIKEQDNLELELSQGIVFFQNNLNLKDSMASFEKIQEICYFYHFNESSLSQEERDSIIVNYQLLRYEYFNVYNYESFLSELDKLIPEYDSLGNPLISWKTKIKDHRKKRFIEGEIYKLWYETFPKNYTVESWKLDQKDSLKAWNNMFRQIGIHFFGWEQNDPSISNTLMDWKLTYYLNQKSIRDYNELKRRFYEEGDYDAYDELSTIYLEVVNGDEKSLELELYAASNFHWCNSYVNAFQFYWMLNELPEYDKYSDLPIEIRLKMEGILKEGEKHECEKCSEILDSIGKTGSPYPK